jgi:hypothetical protein
VREIRSRGSARGDVRKGVPYREDPAKTTAARAGQNSGFIDGNRPVEGRQRARFGLTLPSNNANLQ